MRAVFSVKIKEIWKKHHAKLLMCLLAAVLCSVYAGLLAGRAFPPTEGWYSYYAYLINEEGAVPYLDFELLFPPLYVYMIALFCRVFGYGLMAARVLGVVIFALTGVFAALIFEKLTGKAWLGLTGGMLAVSVLQSEVVQIFYDYIRVMDLFVYLSIYLFLCFLDRQGRPETRGRALDPYLILGTCAAVLASMCKQSSGLIFLLFCIIFLVFLLLCLPRKKELLLQTATVLGTTLLLYGAMAAFLLANGAFGSYIHYNFISSVDAKGGGSLFSLLFGFIPRSAIPLLLGFLVAAAFGALLVLFLLLSRRYPEEKKQPDPRAVLAIRITLPTVMLLLTVLPFLSHGFAVAISHLSGSLFMYFTFLFCTFFFATLAFWLILRRYFPIGDLTRHCKYTFLTGAIFVLGYSVCTSGGLVESQTALAYAFLFVILCEAARFYRRELAVGLLTLLMLTQMGAALARKTANMYSWWGLTTGGYAEQSVESEVPLLAGIKMAPRYATMYNEVYRTVREYSDETDEIFVFPHMPVLYLACERPRATETAIQWFDVSTDAAVRADIEVLAEKRPRIMVLCSIDDSVIEGHESSFRQGESSGLHEMQDFLAEFVVEQGYTCQSSNEISEGYTVTVWCLPQ